MQVMTTNYKQLFLLGLGLTGAVSGGIIVCKIPNIIIAQMQEQTKIIQEQTKQLHDQETTKQVHMQEQTKQLKLKQKWFFQK
jgi:hypothetical protein